ncbi:MAG: hypothetical protein HRT74_14220 [Flavobacteriales bacterium]|nr:hypothetical protein [Flavobacteriales bacterium]
MLKEELEVLNKVDNKNEQIRLLSNEIDRQIHSIYRLWPTNYIAYDLLNGTSEFNDQYNRIQRIAFSNYLRGRVIKLAVARRKILKGEAFRKQAREVLLTMYANPVKNWIESKNSIGLTDAVEELLAK